MSTLEAEIKKLWNRGRTSDEIADEIGISVGRVREILTELGLI